MLGTALTVSATSFPTAIGNRQPIREDLVSHTVASRSSVTPLHAATEGVWRSPSSENSSEARGECVLRLSQMTCRSYVYRTHSNQYGGLIVAL